MNRKLKFREEFPILVYLLESWYDRDTWLEFKTDFEIWEAVFESAQPRGIAAAIEETSSMLKRAEDDIHDFVQCFAENNYHESACNSKIWLQNFNKWLLNRAGSNA
ncbi:MAG: hypothetical protein CL577_00140 [Alteromonadaceae bacterium]|jgi:hypothetical protein|uniref:hypothetical protein n=1 Tax=Rheinheimera aquimaris TaxID=412437 RepID=UPI000C6229E0|nr:hypothetical protein [Rheinheimera aquimaris]MBJ91005.1 hypothetical protein [Alteromonadaceae bacterium]MCD1599274.1 hypothetical protein [Rheinheimera aquimaris]|tara:strand:- start:4985 stop:5302 length:318 start_codon:yes stop_codon:yes gene_type:complete